ncbi:MAG: amino acid ABC transporter permease [Actinomycetota bacterium]
MSDEWGYTVTPDEGSGAVMAALADADRPMHGDSKGPVDWLKKNLFNTWYNSIITVVFGLIALFLAFRLGRFLFVTARWEPVRENMELFMVGTFPRSERTRLIVQLIMFSGAGGLLAGRLRNRSIDLAAAAGIQRVTSSWREHLGVYGALGAFFLVVLVVGARTVNPWLVAAGCVLAAIAGFAATVRDAPLPTRVLLFAPFAIAAGILTRISDLDNAKAYGIAAAMTVLFALVAFVKRPPLTLSAALLVGILGFQALSGTGGIAWFFLAVSLAPIAVDLFGALSDRMIDTSGTAERRTTPIGWLGLAIVAGALVWRVLATDSIEFSVQVWRTASDLGPVVLVLIAMVLVASNDALRSTGDVAVRLGGATLAGIVGWLLARQLDLGGIDWEDWSGLHLNIIVASASIVLAFPVGLLLALGRRSTLPVLRWLSTTYIELIRGVPLISLLLMGQFFIGFFINSDDPLSNVTRATAAVTMFSAAYIAEIVRGGLQAVAAGQTEAGQALGLAPAAITRLLVLPQALRAVIPAMVGQYISLFKDTTLLTIIAITEFLGVREIVHSQADFRGFGIAETLVFVAFGFWAFSYTMSRESQRLERRLSVGQR